MWFQVYEFLKDPPLHFMGEDLGILYNQTFFARAWSIYLLDECSLPLICNS